MTIQIENILIWTKDSGLRNLEIALNSVNVITGEPGKGKSSILHIIDYCLLSSSANGISKKNIDEKASWYGLKLKTESGSKTIARPAYHRGCHSKAYFNDDGVIPEEPDINLNVDSLKKILNREFGVDGDLKVPYGGRFVTAGSRVSYRNFLNFCYQDQYAITASSYLYNKPSDTRVFEGIERTFKMALGIMDAEASIHAERLQSLNKKMVSLEKRKEVMEGKTLEFSEEVEALEQEAIGLGLLDEKDDNLESVLDNLKTISKSSFSKFENATEEISTIEREIYALDKKIKRINNFNDGYREYQALLKKSDDALKPVSYLLDSFQDVIKGTHTAALLGVLENQLDSVKESWKKRNKSSLISDVNEHKKDWENRRAQLKEKLVQLNDVSSKISTPKDVYRYQGKLEVKVELFSEKRAPIDYGIEMERIGREMAELQGKMEDLESRRKFIMNRLDTKLNDYLSRMKLKGYPESQAVFLENNHVINLIVDEFGTVEKMIDIGSASNYLYIHLAYFMSIHEIAKERRVSWMPSFLVLDQVSTPYTMSNDEDVESLNVALREIDSYVEKMKPNGFQVIIMEHIPEKYWVDLGLKNFNLVDREFIGDHSLIN